MKTVSVTCIYSNNTICNLSVNYKGVLTTLKRQQPNDGKPYISFNAMYAAVLNTLKNNGFKCNYITAFGSRWYNIQWIDFNNPTLIETFGYNG